MWLCDTIGDCDIFDVNLHGCCKVHAPCMLSNRFDVSIVLSLHSSVQFGNVFRNSCRWRRWIGVTNWVGALCHWKPSAIAKCTIADMVCTCEPHVKALFDISLSVDNLAVNISDVVYTSCLCCLLRGRSWGVARILGNAYAVSMTNEHKFYRLVRNMGARFIYRWPHVTTSCQTLCQNLLIR